MARFAGPAIKAPRKPAFGVINLGPFTNALTRAQFAGVATIKPISAVRKNVFDAIGYVASKNAQTRARSVAAAMTVNAMPRKRQKRINRLLLPTYSARRNDSSPESVVLPHELAKLFVSS